MQGWEFAHSLICSVRSNKMSDCEQIAQVAHDKWATISDSLRLLMINERIANFFLSESLIRSFAHKLIWTTDKIKIVKTGERKINLENIFWTPPP